MKKIVALILVVCLAMAIGVGATLAYFTDTTETKENTFTVGNVSIELTEPNWDASGAEDAPEVYPGEKLAKDPTVTNIGANPCFVRIKVEGLDCLGNAGDITIEGVSEDWELFEGYYYYKKVLPVDDPETEAKENVTPACFDGIRIPTGLTNGTGEEFSVDVTAYAVQAQGAKPSFTAVQQMTVAEIAAWFTTCGF